MRFRATALAMTLALVAAAAAPACGDDHADTDGSVADAAQGDASQADASQADGAPTEVLPCRPGDGIGCECAPDITPENVSCTAEAVGGEAVCCGAAPPLDPGCFCTRAVCSEPVPNPTATCECFLGRTFDPDDDTRTEVASCSAAGGGTCCKDRGLEAPYCICSDSPCKDGVEIEVASCEPAMVASCPDSHEVELESCE